MRSSIAKQICGQFRVPNRSKNTKQNFFVPRHNPVKADEIQKLQEFLSDKPKILVLTGAGISTESGIPDYRSEGVGLYARSNHRPVQHMEFLQQAKIRQRYWARNFVGWPRFSSIQPNSVHRTLAKWEREQHIGHLVTQNVDRLHTKASSKNVLELHGSGYNVICLSCKYSIDRHEFQHILNALNREIVDQVNLIRPDGDVEIPQAYIDSFQVPACPECGGNLKPEIVFFGDNVPRARAEQLAHMVCNSDGVLVLGSSLQVYSGFRIVLHSYDLGLPIAIVTIGASRGDPKATLKISAKCGDVLPKIVFRKK